MDRAPAPLLPAHAHPAGGLWYWPRLLWLRVCRWPVLSYQQPGHMEQRGQASSRVHHQAQRCAQMLVLYADGYYFCTSNLATWGSVAKPVRGSATKQMCAHCFCCVRDVVWTWGHANKPWHASVRPTAAATLFLVHECRHCAILCNSAMTSKKMFQNNEESLQQDISMAYACWAPCRQSSCNITCVYFMLWHDNEAWAMSMPVCWQRQACVCSLLQCMMMLTLGLCVQASCVWVC